MKTTAILVAMSEELRPFAKSLGKGRQAGEFCGKEITVYDTADGRIYLINTGVGEIAAAAATQAAVERWNPDLIINFGLVGSLSGAIRAGDVVVADKIVHYDYDISALENVCVGKYTELADVYIPCSPVKDRIARKFGLPLVTVASGDKFIADAQAKKQLVQSFGAQICEMESAAIALTAYRNGKQCLFLKIVSDNADENSPVDFVKACEKGTEKLSEIMVKLIKEL